MLPLGLLVVFTCPVWIERHLQHQLSISGYVLEGFSGGDWTRKVSTTSMHSSSTKGFKIGTDFCGWLDPVEVSPGWRKGDWSVTLKASACHSSLLLGCLRSATSLVKCSYLTTARNKRARPPKLSQNKPSILKSFPLVFCHSNKNWLTHSFPDTRIPTATAFQ